jgi:hypothetical protein
MAESERQFHWVEWDQPRSRVWMVQLGLFVIYQPGEKVCDWDTRQIAIYPPGEFIDWDFTRTLASPFAVLSPRMQKLFEDEFPGQLQFLPVRYQQADGTGEVTGYAIAQRLHIFKCLDTEKMLGKWDGDQFRTRGITQYAINAAKIPLHVDIFAARECPTPIFVSDRLRQAIVKQKLSGCRFTPTIGTSGS